MFNKKPLSESAVGDRVVVWVPHSTIPRRIITVSAVGSNWIKTKSSKDNTEVKWTMRGGHRWGNDGFSEWIATFTAEDESRWRTEQHLRRSFLNQIMQAEFSKWSTAALKQLVDMISMITINEKLEQKGDQADDTAKVL